MMGKTIFKMGLIFFVFLISSNIFACKIENVSGSDKTSRKEKAKIVKKAGLRISVAAIKEMNPIYGLGGVNKVVKKYETLLCKKLNSAEFKEKHPGIKIRVVKTDFKGYYSTCNPSPSCLEILQKTIDKLPQVSFPGSEILQVSTAMGKNFKEAFMVPRIKQILGFYEPPLHEFIDKKMTEALEKATKQADGGVLDPQSSAFKNKLLLNLERYRSQGVAAVSEEFRELAQVLDMMEVPFFDSSNIEDSFTNALQEKTRPGRHGYSASTLSTGDDFFSVIKYKNEVVKIIGGDVRGLGYTNMATRLDAYLAFKKSGKIKANGDIIKISEDAMTIANKYMFNSMDVYNGLISSELNNRGGRNLEQMIAAAHKKYLGFSGENHIYLTPEKELIQLMQIRAGSIGINCGKDITCVLNQFTAIFNRIKVLEKAGINSHFGTSCLRAEYQIWKLGLNK